MTSRLDLPPSFPSDFPYSDISPDMADTLEALLQDPGTANSVHTTAEQMSYLYSWGHRELYRALRALDELDTDSIDALSDGMGLYEAASALMRQQPDRVDKTTADRNIEELGTILSSDRGLWTISEAKDEFTLRLPHTARVIGQSALRFQPGHADYVVGGAALSWLAEHNANDDIRGLDFQI